MTPQARASHGRGQSDDSGDPVARYVKSERIAADLDAFAQITATPGAGITRLAFTDEDRRARELVLRLMREAKLSVRTDEVGNLIGRRAGSMSAPAVGTGSHIDSVPTGGNYDGLVGVVGALESIRAMNDAGITTELPLEVISFSSEEAPRFGQSSHRFGSRVMAGTFRSEDVFLFADASGVTLAEALEQFGLDPSSIAKAARPVGDLHAFIELHIEQGTELADLRQEAAVVTQITGTTRYRGEFVGQADHSGGTPMARRRDALAGAAEGVLAVERVARSLGGSLVATVGVLKISPGSISVVPGKAQLGIDIRDVEDAPRDRAKREIQDACIEIANRRGLGFDLVTIRDDRVVPMDPQIQALLRSVCNDLGVSSSALPSHTGHDTASISQICPTGMVLVRNVSGRSHCPEEAIDLPDIVAGVRVLAAALVRQARTGEPRARVT